MKICPDENDPEDGYGKVSDYLSNVLFIKNNNEKDIYYTDDTHFYYVSHGEESQDVEIELCFKSSDDFDDVHNEEASIITSTEYCIKHGSKDKLCSQRGVAVTDICGLKSIAREKNHSPAAPIDYVPKPGQSYSVGREGYERGLMKGKGLFTLHDSLVVVRSWWIDSCKTIDNGETMLLTINDDYFEHISSEYIFDYDDLIDSPLTLPIYDHYTVSSSSECHNIHGIISDYVHDPINEKLDLYIDLENSSPLMFFNDADFDLKQMSVLDLSSQEEERGALQTNRRRLAKKKKFEKTIALPLDNVDKSDSIYYKRKLIGTYNCTITPYFEITIGMRIKYRVDFKKQKLYQIEAYISVEAGIDAELVLSFGELSEDSSVSIELFSKTFKKGKFRSTLGPIVIVTTPSVDVGVSIGRPALKVILGASAHIGGSVRAFGGWDNKLGAYGGVDPSFTYNFAPHEPQYPGSDGRLEAEFSIVVTPKLTFGLYKKDLLTLGAPIGLPKLVGYVGLEQCSGSLFNYDIDFGFDFYVTASMLVEIEKIKLFGKKIFKGYSWEPDEELLSLKIYGKSWDLIECSDYETPAPTPFPTPQPTSPIETTTITVVVTEPEVVEEEVVSVNIITLAENGLLSGIGSYQHWDEPVMFYSDTSGDGFTWNEANSYCNLMHGTELYSVNNEQNFDYLTINVVFAGAVENLFDGNSEHVWIGLNDLDEDGNWTWIRNELSFDESALSECGWESVKYVNGGYCANFFYDDPDYSFVKRSCDDKLNSFACRIDDLHIYNGKYIGVYKYDNYSSWDEANNYCFKKFGTELATILSEDDNTDVYNVIDSVNSALNHNAYVHMAWIGVSNITNGTHFDFADERDSYTRGYNNWNTGEPDNNGNFDECTGMGLQTWNGLDDLWRTYPCGKTHIYSFVCNRPNLYEYHQYGEFIGVQAQYSLKYDDASLVCEEEFGTTLASIHSQSEQDSLFEITHKTLRWNETINSNEERYVWIGGNDIDVANTWVWDDETSFGSYTNWYPGQPSTTNDEHCGVMRIDQDNAWHDDGCDYLRKRFICNRPQSELIYGDYIGINTHDDAYTYTNEEADNYCMSHYGTHLASIHSDTQNDMIALIYQEIDAFDGAWLGLHPDDSNSEFVWRDDSSVSYMNFGLGSSHESGYAFDLCSLMDENYYPMWNLLGCGYSKSAFICNRPTMEIVTDLYVGINFYNDLGGVYYTWDDAEEYCINTYGTHLASILDETQREEAMTIADAFGYDLSLAIGLTDKNSEGTWEWIDGNTFSYSYWRPSQPDGDGDCGEIRAYEAWEDNWNDMGCSYAYFKAFLCNREPIVYQDGDYVVLNFLNNRYFTYTEANTYCYDNYYGSTLATQMDNDDDFNLQLEMLDIVRGEYDSYAWIGISDENSEGTYSWQDGSGTVSSSSNYFANNQPDDWNNEDCVELISDWYGWNDRDCDTERNTFICNNPYYTYRHGDYIGIVETSGNSGLYLNHVDANNYCKQAFGTNLASVYNSDGYDEILTVSDELNNKIGSTLETHIGLSNPSEDHVNWVWEDGSIANYTDWYSGEPNSNQFCGVIDDENFHSIDCNSVSRSWICNTDVPKTDNLLCYYDKLWNVIKGSWSQYNDDDEYPCAISNTNSDRGNVIWIGDSVSNDYAYIEDFRFDYESFTLTVLLEIDSGVGDAGILFRATSVSSINDYGQQYYFGIDIPDNYITLGRLNYGWQRLNTDTTVPTLSYGTMYELKIVASSNGNTDFYLDDYLLFGGTQTLTDYSRGSIGLRSFKAPFTVYSIVLEPN